MKPETFSSYQFVKEYESYISELNNSSTLEDARKKLLYRVFQVYNNIEVDHECSHILLRSRDCAQAFLSVFSQRAEKLSGFSTVQVFYDIAKGVSRNDLTSAFYAEMIHWVRGLEGRAAFNFFGNATNVNKTNSKQPLAQKRSALLDELGAQMKQQMDRFTHGLCSSVVMARKQKKEGIISYFGANESDWNNWIWQTKHLITQPDILANFIFLSEEEYQAIDLAVKNKIPFAITPYYMSLLDKNSKERTDISLRKQVIPSLDYVKFMLLHKNDRKYICDFMLESDTSPTDMIVRRYPKIVILKPCNTCPQICVYCQRNWEIEEAMAPSAFADIKKINKAIQWIEKHPEIQEVLITGGDPLVLQDDLLDSIIEQLFRIPHIQFIRIGTRTLVTMPMRINHNLLKMLSRYCKNDFRQISFVTHVQHCHEITPDMANAVYALRQVGIKVYNQHVYTFYVSRRFETVALRLKLRSIGVDPYYTFVTKGKDEIIDYRVPLSRLLQEQKEESRLLPGLSRTDEAVLNIPGLGKNYIRAKQHRDILCVLPDGSRLYEFHPWEKNVTPCKLYYSKDVPIYDYLNRLHELGENPSDYDSIWYYF